MSNSERICSKEHSYLFLMAVMLVVCFGGLSCGKDEDNGLDFWVTPNASYILPGTIKEETTACYEADISGPRIHFEHVNTAWTKTDAGDFYPVLVKIKFKASSYLSSDYTCEITGGESSYLSLASWLGAGTSSTYFTTSTGAVKSPCPIECGGLPIPDDSKSRAFTVVGEIKLIGYSVKKETDGSYTQIPVSKTSKLTIQNIPN